MRILHQTITILLFILWVNIPHKAQANSVDKDIRVVKPQTQGNLFYKGRELRVGLVESYPPSFVWKNDSTPSGFNTSVGMAVMKAANYRYSFHIGKAATIRKMLNNNELDAVIGYFFIKERETQLLFSMPFRAVYYRVAVLDNCPYQSSIELNLSGVRVALCQEDQIKKRDLARFLNKVEIIRYDTYKDAMYAVYKGECTAMIKTAVGSIYPDTIGHKVLKQLANSHHENIDNTISTSINNSELMASLNAALFRLTEDGIISQIQNQWMPIDNTKNKIASWENILTLAVITLFFLLFALILILIRMIHERQRSKHQRANSLNLLNKLPIPIFILSTKKGFLVYEFINEEVRKVTASTANYISDYKKVQAHTELLTEACRKTVETGETLSFIDPRHDDKQFVIYLNACTYQGDTCIIKTWVHTKELLKLKEEAEKNDRKMDEFLANISHEVRTPLNAIVGFSNLLPEMDSAEREAAIVMINIKSIELNKLINDILLISKFESGTLQGKYVPTNIISTIKIFTDRVISEYPDKINVPIVYDSYYGTLEQVMDLDFGYLVVKNLLNNAIKFTESGTIHVGFIEENGDSILYVEDSGIGIPKENQQDIFNKFTKINTFTQGTGLGIPIVLAIMRVCAGQVGVYSQEGQGTLFWISYRKPWIKKDITDSTGLQARKKTLANRWKGFWIDCQHEDGYIEYYSNGTKLGGRDNE